VRSGSGQSDLFGHGIYMLMCHQKTLLACLLLCLVPVSLCMVREDKGQTTTRLSASLPYCAAVSLCEARQGLASRIQVVPKQ
jgi:hypothetical protein